MRCMQLMHCAWGQHAQHKICSMNEYGILYSFPSRSAPLLLYFKLKLPLILRWWEQGSQIHFGFKVTLWWSTAVESITKDQQSPASSTNELTLTQAPARSTLARAH